ncbi:MAG: M50 family metallopeptidase [Alphaproteobacteria bacterium]|nr:M50 family metallopeptidase [Alphaproteobacteria bacterium]
MGRIFDLILGALKWPVALCSLFYLPAMVQALHYFQFNNMKFFAFLGGGLAYLAIKILAMARSNVSMQILAHEFTHIFFAWLTFHKVVHIHLNPDESGGAMGFKGKGNWLIVIGPYFFPLFLFFLMLFATFLGDKIPHNLWVNGLFGYFFAYHLEAVVVQIHGQQPDFKEVGFPFCWMFLPGANLFVCSAVAAFNNGGWEGVMKYGAVVYKLGLRYFTNL